MTGRPPPHAFEVVEARVGGAPGLAVRGEVDLDALPRFEFALDRAIRDSVGAFILDLSDVEFMDSSGLRVLLHARTVLSDARVP